MSISDSLIQHADRLCRNEYGNSVFIRGLLEISNYCVMNCKYCGLRRDNFRLKRYRMTFNEVITAVERGWQRGIRSFVLQGGEDPELPPKALANLADAIRKKVPGNYALTFSFGTMAKDDYAQLKAAGVDRYLIRFETSDPDLHQQLRGTTLAKRLTAIEAVKSLGFEAGSGFMTGLPGYSEEQLYRDIELARSLDLDMAGVGPFIPHPQTPLAKEPGSPLALAVQAVALLRLARPKANIPATTAAGSLAPDGREQMLAAGANVLMPNIGPVDYKKLYEHYPGKICLDEDGLTCLGCLAIRVKTVGKELSMERGDSHNLSLNKGKTA